MTATLGVSELSTRTTCRPTGTPSSVRADSLPSGKWCTYSTVPAVTVYDLARERHIPGVDALPYLWCGGAMTRVDVDRLGFAPTTSRPRPEGLFAAADDGA